MKNALVASVDVENRKDLTNSMRSFTHHLGSSLHDLQLDALNMGLVCTA